MKAIRHHLAEAGGTFTMVLVGTGAMVVNDATDGAITHVGVSIAFGAVVAAMILLFGNLSGAHINPAVTLGFAASGRFPWPSTLSYIGAQCSGAAAASLLLKALAPAHPTLGATVPAIGVGPSFALEVGLALVLMFVILTASAGAGNVGMRIALIVGGVVFLESFLAGPCTGASMNPARSLGPALATGGLDALWIYATAPAIGALLAVPLCRRVCSVEGCCPEPARS